MRTDRTHIYGGSHPPGWLRDDPELDPAPESSGGGSTPKSEPTEEAEHGPPREAAPRGRALGPPTSDVQQRRAERRRSKRDYSPDLVTPLDDLHAQEIDSFFAGDPAADSLDVILMRAEVRTESHLNVGREQEEPLVKEEQEEEAEVVKDEEVSVEMEAGTADEADDVALPANRAYVEGRFYPYGSWRCFFCEAINPVAEDQCLTTHAGGPKAGAPCDGRWINGIDIGRRPSNGGGGFLPKRLKTNKRGRMPRGFSAMRNSLKPSRRPRRRRRPSAPRSESGARRRRRSAMTTSAKRSALQGGSARTAMNGIFHSGSCAFAAALQHPSPFGRGRLSRDP